MSSLEKYVEKVKKETEGFSNIEKLRYIYWDLGSKFAFDLDFSFGNSKTRKQIYDHSRSEDDLNRCLENNTAICKSIAYIFSYVMKELGVNIESVIDEETAMKTAKKMEKGTFDLEDFLEQLHQIKKLGPLENIIKMLPGAKKMGLNNVNINPKDLAHIEAIIQSMTPKERKNPDILKASRKIRIAKGSGRSVEEVNRLLKQFEEMKKMMKMMKNGNFKMPF